MVDDEAGVHGLFWHWDGLVVPIRGVSVFYGLGKGDMCEGIGGGRGRSSFGN
jgi:hypothetical protein